MAINLADFAEIKCDRPPARVACFFVLFGANSRHKVIENHLSSSLYPPKPV